MTLSHKLLQGLFTIVVTGPVHSKFPVLLSAHNRAVPPCPWEVKYSHVTCLGQENETDVWFL